MTTRTFTAPTPTDWKIPMDLLTEIVLALPMQVPWLPGGDGGQDPVMPSGGNGFANRILGGIMGLGVLVLAMIWISKKPKNRR